MSHNGIKFEYTRALVGARRDWASKDRCGNYLAVALAVHNYTNGHGERAYASAKRLASDTGVSERTAERALKFLRDEGLIHLDVSGGRSGDGRVWASEYSLRIPAKWSGATQSQSATRQSQPDTSESHSATSGGQPATSAPQPDTYAADHQIRVNIPFKSEPVPSSPHPSNPLDGSDFNHAEETYCWDCNHYGGKRCDRHSLIDVGASSAEPDWGSMVLTDNEEPPF